MLAYPRLLIAYNAVVVVVRTRQRSVEFRGCRFRIDEPSGLRPGLKRAIVTENKGVRGGEILNDIADPW